MRVIRATKDSELTPEQLTARESKRRAHEIDAQIVNAIEKSNPVELLLTHPAGLMGKGSCGHLHADKATEETFIRNRYGLLKAKYEAGTELEGVDLVLAKEVAAGSMVGVPRFDRLTAIRERGLQAKRGDIDIGPFPRARSIKDLSEHEYQDWAVSDGVMVELSQEEVIAEHEQNVISVMSSINEERVVLGLKLLKVVKG